ncbi:MAG TPA: helix-turn-helix domain-containing protein [Clostridiales bacterium]|nr:helix-turn-helix domain-containing protein [Clostridiales bacterium]
MKLEEKLISLRKEKGLSQMKLAEMMNVSRQAISRWEVGAAVPSTDNLKFLGNLYGVSLEYLLHNDAPKPNQNETPMQKRIIEKQESRRKTVFVVLMAVLAVAVIVLSVMLLVEQPKKPISMGNISGSEVNVTGKDDFDVNW